MMKILISYWINKQEPKVLEIELDEQETLKNAERHISRALDQDVILVPTIIKDAKNSQTVVEYCQKIQKSAPEVHFNALIRTSLDEKEQAVLASLLADSDNNLKDVRNLVEFLGTVLPKDVQEALVVRFTNKTNMFGQTYKDNISKAVETYESRYSVQVHPYPWLAAGASNVIVHRNAFNELFVALVYNQRRDRRLTTDVLRQAGIPDYWKLPEGYMHPKPCKGGENGIALVSSDDMDESEELMLKNIPMQEAYKTIKVKHSGIFKSHEEQSSYDNSTKECAVRESYEEVGYKASLEDVQLVSQREENRLIPTIANVYLIKTKQRSDIVPPSLTVDGVEIKEAMWGKLKAFRFEQDHTKVEKIRIVLDYYDEDGNCYPVEVPIKYALMIGQAIRKLRDEEIQKGSMIEEFALFASRENIEARVKQILKTPSLNKHQKTLQDVFGASPESYLLIEGVSNSPGNLAQEKDDNLKALANLGKKAENYHKKIMALASAFKNAPFDQPLNAEQLIEIVKEVPVIESNLFRSRITLFPLARLYSATCVPNEKKPEEITIPWPLSNNC
jgi:8-oxo-dGTP pyrophosphatase MutT (NUDIX family)